MPRNFLLVAVGALVVFAAVAGTGWLFLRGQPAPRRVSSDTPAAPGPRKRTQVEVPAGPPKGPKPPAAKGPNLVPPKTSAPADVCKALDALLAEYETISLDGNAGAVASVDRLQTLRERSQKIEKIVEQITALGCAAIPCISDAIRADGRVGKIERQANLVRAVSRMPCCREVTAALADAYQSTDAWGTKMAIITQLAEANCPEGIDFLCSRIDAEQEFRLRGAILKLLANKKAPCASLAAQRIATQDENPNVRVAAIRALAESEDQTARLVLEDRARSDPDVTVRQNAIQAYGRIFKDQGIPLLEDLLRTDPNIRIKSMAILALQELLTPEARRILERTANDPTAGEDVRARATGALAAMDRMQNGSGLPSVGAKLDAIEPINIDRMKPLAPIGSVGDKR